jgi:hypothetical protein
MKTKRKIKRGATIEKIHYGEEPVWDDSIDMDAGSFILRSYAWYNAMSNLKHYKNWCLEWMKENNYDVENIKIVNRVDYRSFMFGHKCRMLSNGAPIPDAVIERVKSHIQSMIKLGGRSTSTKTEVVEKPKVSVQDRMKEQVIEYSGNINIVLDKTLDEILSKKKPQLDVVKWLKDNEVKSIQSGMISQEFRPLLDELNMVYNKEDSQLVEGWGFLSRPQLKKYRDFVRNIVDTCEEYSTVLKKTRKPRRKKLQTKDSLVKNLKYMVQTEDGKFTSIDPKQIIGAIKLVTYNTKTDQFSIYEKTRMVDGLSIKGTTIVGLDNEKSVCKRVGKDKSIIIVGGSGGIRSINNAYKNLKNKESVPSPRLNNNVVILQAFK